MIRQLVSLSLTTYNFRNLRRHNAKEYKVARLKERKFKISQGRKFIGKTFDGGYSS